MNLFDLIVSCCKWVAKQIRYCLQLFAEMLRLTWRRPIIVGLALAAGIGGGLWYSRPSHKLYRSDGLLLLNGATSPEVRAVLYNLERAGNAYVAPRVTLANQLEVDNSVVAGVDKIRTFYVADCLNDSTPDYVDYRGKINLTDTLNVRSNRYLAWRVYTYNVQGLPQFEQAVIDYLNRDSYLQAKYQSHRSVLEEEVLLCERQMVYEDSLARVYYFKTASEGQIEFSARGKTMVMGKRSIDLLHNDMFEMVAKKKKVDSEMATCTAPVVVVSHLAAMPRAVNGRMKCLVIGCLIGWVIGLCIAGIFDKRKELYQWLKK